MVCKNIILNFKRYHIKQTERRYYYNQTKQSSKQMTNVNAPKCDCSTQNQSFMICINQPCNNRRLCGICQKNHKGHQDKIKYIQSEDDFSAYSINSKDNRKKTIKSTMKLTIQQLTHSKNKLIEFLRQNLNITPEIDQLFDKCIQRPLKTIMNSTTVQQTSTKLARIREPIDAEQLQQIALQLRQLEKPCYQNIKWLTNMTEWLQQQFGKLKTFLQQTIMQMRDRIKSIVQMFPFKKNLDESIELRIIKQQMKEQKKIKDSWEFLHKYKKIIGWQPKSLMSASSWITLNKSIGDIDALNLGAQELSKIPQQLFLFEHLKKLNLDNNSIQTIQNVGSLIFLEQLYLSSNKIKKIQNLERLGNLRSLQLFENQIEHIQGLNNLIYLQRLWLSKNQIKKIQKLEDLINLKELHLGYNKSIRVIQNLSNLRSLQLLSLNNCQIEKLDGIGHLQNLKQLVIYKNPLSTKNEEKTIIEKYRKNGLKIKTVNDSK